MPAAATSTAASTPSRLATTPALPKASATATAAAPSAAPGLGSFSATLRLNLEDVFTGTGKPVVTNPTAVVTGLFKEVLRRDPTASELQNYLNRLNLLGVNGVVAGLYTSDAFRQNAVNNYYLELLGRTPTQQELSRGATRLALATPEPTYAASLAGSQEFYSGSASGGGKFGTQPSATTYVDLLYRSLLGQATGPSAAPLVQQVQGGLPISRAANQFVNTAAYRTVKVGEVYEVLGQAASPTDIAGYMNGWFMAGGQGGISRSLLATSANVQRIEAGLVTTPDVAAAADLQQLLLAPYIDGPTGFYEQYRALVGDCSDTSSPACKNPAVFNLMKNGGTQRGIPNNSLQPLGITATVTTLVPTQNEIDMTKSLYFPLTAPDTLKAYFAGGTVNPFGGPIITADAGTYIVDGHHRWSSIYMINPYAQLSAIDLGYVPNPQTALRQAELGVAATNGFIEGSTAGNQNLYTIGEAEFDAYVKTTILGGDDPAAIFKIFQSNLDYPKGLSQDEQLPYIQDYLWGNVGRMRDMNPFIPGAPSRAVMPQLDPPLPVLNNLDSGLVSYSFPTISYLG